MKKFLAFLLGLVLLVAVYSNLILITGATSPDFLQLYEMEDIVKNGMITANFEGASGGKITYSSASGDNYVSAFTVDAPKTGTYAVWVRAFVKSQHQCTLAYTDNSVLSGKIFKLLGNTDLSASFVWIQLDARDEVNGNPSHTKNVTLNEGENLFEWRVRSTANIVDTILVNDGSTKTTHYFDCVIVTDDISYDPNTDWESPVVTTTEATTTAPMETIDFHQQIEAEDMTLSNMKTMSYSDASGTGVIYSDNEADQGTFETQITVPKTGEYTVWIRAFVKSNHQCTFFYTDRSVYGNKICLLVKPDANGGEFVWFRADVRDTVTSEPITQGRFAFTEGEQTLGFKVRTLANVEDTYLTAINGASSKSTHYIDAIVVTGDPTFDPNPKPVETTIATTTATTTPKVTNNSNLPKPAPSHSTAATSGTEGSVIATTTSEQATDQISGASGCGATVSVAVLTTLLTVSAFALRCRRRKDKHNA